MIVNVGMLMLHNIYYNKRQSQGKERAGKTRQSLGNCSVEPPFAKPLNEVLASNPSHSSFGLPLPTFSQHVLDRMGPVGWWCFLNRFPDCQDIPFHTVGVSEPGRCIW